MTAPSMSHPSLQVSSGRRTVVQIKIPLSQFCEEKNYRKKRNSGSGYVFDKTVKQGLERKVVDFEQAKLLRESSGKTWKFFYVRSVRN